MTAKRQPLNDFLKSVRLKQGLSQRQVAERLGLHSPQYISNIERGVCTPSLGVLVDLAEIYQLDIPNIVDLMVEEYRKRVEGQIDSLRSNKG